MKGKTRERAAKPCQFCQHSFSVLYRVKTINDQDWHFACKSCQVELKLNEKTYQYGGTWKQHKR
ncbi:MAG: Uncharacterised protein [Glaciecola sp. HTCC2999]|jgi:hypothetical protein|nr:MAG: Uncharacterised protein [Glaciecola sp. HTCC2999]